MLTYPENSDDFENLLGDVGLDTPSQRDSAPLVNDSASSAPKAPEPGDGVLEPIPAMVNEAEMARILGLGISRVRGLFSERKLVKPKRGQYDVRASLLTYIEDLRMKASRMGPGMKTTPANSKLHDEKLRLAKEQADKIEIQNAAARGELVKSSEVERAWAAMLRDVRAAMLAVPSRCGATLPHLTAYDVAEIDREIRAALEGLADGN